MSTGTRRPTGAAPPSRISRRLSKGAYNGLEASFRESVALTLPQVAAYQRQALRLKVHIRENAMKFFVDTADVAEIKELAATGILDGVTTNPTLVAKAGRDFKEIVK